MNASAFAREFSTLVQTTKLNDKQIKAKLEKLDFDELYSLTISPLDRVNDLAIELMIKKYGTQIASYLDWECA